ncbi:MAG: GNAT family N-acetyltransferase [Anaerolineales bacterium]|nr:GNAT family N-acetyltransferase [Anaerolineales bacterium]
MLTFTLREFDLDRDYEAALALWRNAGPGIGVGLSDTRDEIAKKLTRDPDLFLVAEVAGRLAGTVIGGWDGRRGLIYHLAVAAELRGNGLGAALLREVESRLQAKGCRKVYLLITPQNTEVIPFYEARGWSEMPVRILTKILQP